MQGVVLGSVGHALMQLHDLPGCCSHRASPQNAFTVLYLGIFQPKKGTHTPHSPNFLRVRVAITVLDT